MQQIVHTVVDTDIERCIDAFSSIAFASPLDLDQLCGVMQVLKKKSKECHELSAPVVEGVHQVAMSDDEIKATWSHNREQAANLGTWFHLQAELWLNRDLCYLEGPEMRLFLSYVLDHLQPMGVEAFRTEWEVVALPECALAGGST